MSKPLPPDLEKAKSLIQAKRYDEARAILITSDDPLADKWLARLNAAPDSPGPHAPAAGQPSFTGKLVLTIVLLFCLFVPGLIALTIFAKEAEQHPNAPGAGGLIGLNKWIFYILVAAAVLIVGVLAIGFISAQFYRG